MPWLPILLRYNERQIETRGLVDSGATVNVIPYRFGIELGASWDETMPFVKLAGNLGRSPAKGLLVSAVIGEFPPVDLLLAWSARDDTPLILGQFNFFQQFIITFDRANFEFEINPKAQIADS